MPQKQVGWRFDPYLLEKFKEICRSHSFKPSKAIEYFMKSVVEIGDPSLALSRLDKGSEAERKALETQARILLAMLRNDEYWIHTGDGSRGVIASLFDIIPKLENEELIHEIELELSKKRK
ncbi:MAG: hypothetical protein QW186_09595 [Candidatus Bathyarchaeia archaeon]